MTASTFSTKYPAFNALLSLVATVGQDAAGSGTLVQRLESMANVIGPVMAFIPQANLLGTELTALKASPSDIEQGAEVLVTDLAFTSVKAKAIIQAAFPVAENLVSLIPQVEAVIAAVKA